MTRSIEADLLGRVGYYIYPEGDRRDVNQTYSFSLRYQATDWLSAFGSAFWSVNRSNQPVFDYDSGTVGGGLGLSLRF